MSERKLTFDEALALAQDTGADPAARMGAAGFLAAEGLFTEMAAVAETLEANPETAPAARRLALTCRQFARWGLHERLIPWSDETRGDPARARLTRSAMLLHRDGAQDAVIVFIGAASQYWVSLYMLEKYLPADRHILFLKDPLRISYALGTPAFGASHASITDGLRHFLTTRGVRRFHVLGTSSGGFAALHFAFTAGAAGVLALSPETTLAPLATSLHANLTPALLADLLPRLPVPLDLADLLQDPAHPAPVPALLLHAEHHAEDAAMCARLHGLDGVRIEALPDSDQHDILLPLITGGGVGPLFARVFGAA